MNVHTTANLAGVIRGQVMKASVRSPSMMGPAPSMPLMPPSMPTSPSPSPSSGTTVSTRAALSVAVVAAASMQILHSTVTDNLLYLFYAYLGFRVSSVGQWLF